MPIVSTSRAFTVAGNLSAILQPQYCDITLVSGNVRLKTHRVLLATIPSLDTIMKTKLQADCKHELIVTSVIPESELSNFLTYLKTGKIQITGENVQSLWKICKKFNLNDIYQELVHFTTELLDKQNCISLLASVLIQYNDGKPPNNDLNFEELIKRATKLLKSNQQEICESAQLQQLSLTHLNGLCTFLNESSDTVPLVYNLVLRWSTGLKTVFRTSNRFMRLQQRNDGMLRWFKLRVCPDFTTTHRHQKQPLPKNATVPVKQIESRDTTSVAVLSDAAIKVSPALLKAISSNETSSTTLFKASTSSSTSSTSNVSKKRKATSPAEDRDPRRSHNNNNSSACSSSSSKNNAIEPSIIQDLKKQLQKKLLAPMEPQRPQELTTTTPPVADMPAAPTSPETLKAIIGAKIQREKEKCPSDNIRLLAAALRYYRENYGPEPVPANFNVPEVGEKKWPKKFHNLRLGFCLVLARSQRKELSRADIRALSTAGIHWLLDKKDKAPKDSPPPPPAIEPVRVPQSDPSYRGLCMYAGRNCPNERTVKTNGEPHSLCNFHRYRACKNQKRLDQKKSSIKKLLKLKDGTKEPNRKPSICKPASIQRRKSPECK